MPLPLTSRREGERSARLSPETGLQPASRSLAIIDLVPGFPRLHRRAGMHGASRSVAMFLPHPFPARTRPFALVGWEQGEPESFKMSFIAAPINGQKQNHKHVA